jgi:hypothetical protein
MSEKKKGVFSILEDVIRPNGNSSEPQKEKSSEEKLGSSKKA